MKTIAEQLGVPFVVKDKQGNEIWYEFDGYWCKKEYDSEGREIYCEDSRCFWRKCEYDSVGNRIYYEDSSGLIKDNRPKPATTHGEDWDDLAYGSVGKKVFHINSDAETKPDDVITLNGIRYKRIDE